MFHGRLDCLALVENTESHSIMGCTSSSPGSIPATERQRRISRAQSKVVKALMKRKLEQDREEHPITFERILLKFEKMHLAVTEVKKTFDEYAVNGVLDYEHLNSAIHSVYRNMTDEEIRDLFETSDFEAAKAIGVKEFLVALTLGIVFDQSDLSTPTTKKQEELKNMLNLIVSAYLLFDKKCQGFIQKTTVDAMMEEHKQGSGAHSNQNAMLSQQRWKEMVRSII